MEKLISFSWGQYRFVDSYTFLSSSLSRLVQNTPITDLQITRERIHDIEGSRHEMEKWFDLVTRKGVYPYEYKDSFDRFGEMELPPKVWLPILKLKILAYLSI